MKRLLFILTLLFLLSLSVGVAVAAPLNDTIIRAGEEINRDLVVPGGNLLIEAGAVVNGNVTVFGGNATITGQVNGDVAVFGGNMVLAGEVQGDIALFGGNLSLEEAAVISGDCVAMGGSVSGLGRERVTCTSFRGFPRSFLSNVAPDSPPPPPGWPVARFVRDLSELFSRSLLLSIAALIVAAALPTQLNRVTRTIVAKPAASGVVGVLTAVAVPSLVVLLLLLSLLLIIVCIGLLGFPLALLILAGLVAAGVMGWVAVGHLLGQKLIALLNMPNQSLLVTTVAGTALLTLGVGFISFFPWAGGFFSWLLTWSLVAIGLGAVALTQFGRYDYPAGVPPRPSQKVADILDNLPDRDSDETDDIPVYKA